MNKIYINFLKITTQLIIFNLIYIILHLLHDLINSFTVLKNELQRLECKYMIKLNIL